MQELEASCLLFTARAGKVDGEGRLSREFSLCILSSRSRNLPAYTASTGIIGVVSWLLQIDPLGSTVLRDFTSFWLRLASFLCGPGFG
jgi:hypothetical protein